LIALFGATWMAQQGWAEATLYRMRLPVANSAAGLADADLQSWAQWFRDRGYDVAGWDRPGATVEIILRDAAKQRALLDAGLSIVEQRHSSPLSTEVATRAVPAGYVDPTALETFLMNEASDHPSITDLTVIGVTLQGRNIYALEISSNPGVPEDKPTILFNALHHSREVVTPHVVMDAITYLTDQHAAANPQVVDWLSTYKVYCVPMVNPDGSVQVHTVDDFHRKNMQPVCVGTNQGVDLNRNYPYHWGFGVDACERGSGSSGSECSDAYRGPSASSELETQAMIAFAEQQQFSIAVSYHASGRFIDYPYACNDGNPDERMPEHEIIDELMHGAADAIFAVDGVDYSVFSPIAIGPVNGDDTSWYYAHVGTYALLIEVGTSFQPSFAEGMASVNRNRGGWLYLLDRLDGARMDVEVTDLTSGEPIVADVTLLNYTFDTDELPRLTDPTFGRRRWLVPENDTYTVRVSANGYLIKTVAVPVVDEPVNVAVALEAHDGAVGDIEPDGDIDMLDVFEFTLCREAGTLVSPCTRFDFDGDGTLTLDDYADLAGVLTGPQ
jgi:murein tripeptide amidase MpaA